MVLFEGEICIIFSLSLASPWKL